MKTLLKAGIKRHKNSLIGTFILILIVAIALSTVISVWTNSQNYIKSEIKQAGFGKLTAWVSNVPDIDILANDIKNLKDIEQVQIQNLIYSNYTINEQESDSEGQLINFIPDENRYKFFADNLYSYREDIPTINSGEVYISPSLISIFGVQIGDEITFPIARQGQNIVFKVKGYYEDPFMGSSMIGMKGFLICEKDYNNILEIINNSGIDALARGGAMLHIFTEEYSQITASELNSIINSNTDLPKYTEFIHSENAISGFMLILQNAFSGLMIAFALILFCTIIVVLGHSLSNTIESDFVNMGILKTIGFTTKILSQIQLIQYLISIISGMILGLVISIPLSNFISQITLTTMGVAIPAKLPFNWCILTFMLMLILLTAFIMIKTKKIRYITPIKIIRGETNNINLKKPIPIYKDGLSIHLSLRQLITSKRKYIGACIIAILLVFFISVVESMNMWLGSDGKGMMDAFNPAEHDIGVQIFGNLTVENSENTILSYTNIDDSYLLAMPSVIVNGIDYTANVISEPNRFHIIQGRACTADNEIVLTEFVAKDLGVTIGDKLIVKADNGSDEYIISGIYQCANDMGNNIGMSREGYLKIGQDNPNIWCYHYFLADTSQKQLIIETLEEAYGGDIHIHENTWTGLFGIISAMQALILFMYIVVIIFILIVTIMTGSKILSSEQKDLGIYKAIGFSTKLLRITFALRFAIVAIIGSAIGIIFSILFTDPLVSSIMKLAGISNFSSNPTITNILFPPIIVILLFTSFAYFISLKIKKVDITILISE